MEHNKAQRRMLICAAFFSFGALSGALTVARLSADGMECLVGKAVGLFSSEPLLLIPLAAVLMPLLLLLFGASAIGSVFAACLICCAGITSGAAACASLRLGWQPLLAGSFLLLYAVCLVQIGASMLRRSSLVRAQLASGGRLKPDYGYDAAPVFTALSVLILAAFAFAHYILRS